MNYEKLIKHIVTWLFNIWIEIFRLKDSGLEKFEKKHRCCELYFEGLKNFRKNI